MPSDYLGIGMIMALAFCSCNIAEKKNRSKWGWFILTLFLGPLATLIVHFLKEI